jgi:hypothetical protein
MLLCRFTRATLSVARWVRLAGLDRLRGVSLLIGLSLLAVAAACLLF